MSDRLSVCIYVRVVCVYGCTAVQLYVRPYNYASASLLSACHFICLFVYVFRTSSVVLGITTALLCWVH